MENNNFKKNEVELRKELHGIIMRANAFARTNDPRMIADLVSPGFFEECGPEQVLRATAEVLNGDLSELSEKFTKLFHQFNEEYFDGRVPEYTVIVRYVLLGESRSSHRVCDRRIWLRAGSEPHMVCSLLSTMAQIVADDSEELAKKLESLPELIPGDVHQQLRDEVYGKEMERLWNAGAPTWAPPGTGVISAERFIEEFKRSVTTVGDGQSWQPITQ